MLEFTVIINLSGSNQGTYLLIFEKKILPIKLVLSGPDARWKLIRKAVGTQRSDFFLQVSFFLKILIEPHCLDNFTLLSKSLLCSLWNIKSSLFEEVIASLSLLNYFLMSHLDCLSSSFFFKRKKSLWKLKPASSPKPLFFRIENLVIFIHLLDDLIILLTCASAHFGFNLFYFY